MSLLTFLLTGKREDHDLSDLDIYRRILATDDGYTRSHKLTQAGQPKKAKQWPARSRRYHATISLVSHDERHRSA